MLKFKTKVGARGQIVIPKVLRESLGINEHRTIFLEVDGKTVRLIPGETKNIVREWEKIAKEEGGDVSTFIYGDKLYEQLFS